MDDGGLLDSGAALGHLLEVDSLESEVVLFFFLSGDEDSLRSVDSLVDLESQEVLDFQGFSSIDDVHHDREVGVGEHHLELVADCHSCDHVANNASDCAQDCVSLLLLQPHAESESGLVALLGVFSAHLEWDVAEALGELAEWALDGDCAGLDLDLDSFWDFEFLLSDDELHDYYYGWLVTNIII